LSKVIADWGGGSSDQEVKKGGRQEIRKGKKEEERKIEVIYKDEDYTRQETK